jgi:hypothetical protein
MLGANVTADPSHRFQAEVQKDLCGRPDRPALLPQESNQALVGDAEAAGVKEQEERAAGSSGDDIVEDVKDVAVMRDGGNALAGVLIDDCDELGGRLVLHFNEEAGPVHGPTAALTLSDPEDALGRRR